MEEIKLSKIIECIETIYLTILHDIISEDYMARSCITILIPDILRINIYFEKGTNEIKDISICQFSNMIGIFLTDTLLLLQNYLLSIINMKLINDMQDWFE